ncbi:hypothetical protein BH23CHL4_BH23CHL4_04520 [soil metagenome]
MTRKRRIGLLVAGALAGLTAAVVMLLVMAATRTWLGVPPPPEAVPDRLAPTLSIDRFFDLFEKYGGYNGLKKFGVWTGIRAILAAGAGFGLVYSIISETRRSRSMRPVRGGVSPLGLMFIAGAAAAMWIGTIALLWPVLGANYRGLPPSQAQWLSAGTLLFEYLLFGFVLVAIYHTIAPIVAWGAFGHSTALNSPTGEFQAGTVKRGLYPRRAVVAAIAAGLLALPTTVLIRRLWDRATFDYDGRPYSGPGVRPITPNDKFYSVTKNVVDPNVKRSWWGLEIGGMVENPTRLDFTELSSLPATDQETTLMCISNRIGSGLFSNAVWTGVPLSDILTSAGVKEGAIEVKLYGADGFTDTFAIEKALDPTTMVAYMMNGEPLPERHGFPARVIVPGLYGEKNVKWVTGIEVVDHDAKGFYEQQGWGPNFEAPTRSDIFSPQWRRTRGDNFSNTFAVGAPVRIKGRAFAGNRGIALVEASTDGGETWNPVQIDYPGTDLTWTFWSYLWVPPAAGEYVVTSRAVDGDGQPQPTEARGTVPQGATGYHRVNAQVA